MGNPQLAAPADPDLTAIIRAWPTLPEPIRAGIRALVAAQRSAPSGDSAGSTPGA